MANARRKKIRSIVKNVPAKLLQLPIVDLVPLSFKAWKAMPDEKKQEVIQNLIIAGAKMAAQSGGKREF